MVTKRKCGTSKMKRVMSGGKGKVSRYTQKFKQSYNRFINIEDSDDDNSKLKKMEEWGRMRGIYKFLKYQNKKYTGESGDEKTALEKMEENINRTPNNEGYKSAISCFEQSENDILSGEEKCIPEEDYIKGVGGMETTSEESSPAVTEEAAAPAVTEEAAADTEEAAPAPDVTEEAPVVTEEAPTDDAAAVNTEADTETSPDDEAAAAAPAVDDTGDTTEQTEEEKPLEQQGGRSKRRPRSSRRGKSMKSKKGRRTRRKQRVGRR